MAPNTKSQSCQVIISNISSIIFAPSRFPCLNFKTFRAISMAQPMIAQAIFHAVALSAGQAHGQNNRDPKAPMHKLKALQDFFFLFKSYFWHG
ncbi:MAG: hypothetical protein WC476_11745 [Phycisphaerae bacterium]